MTFPESPREGSAAHESALQRLEAARHERDRKREAYEAAEDDPARSAAGGDLAAAQEQMAAREAWVSWVERGY